MLIAVIRSYPRMQVRGDLGVVARHDRAVEPAVVLRGKTTLGLDLGGATDAGLVVVDAEPDLSLREVAGERRVINS